MTNTNNTYKPGTTICCPVCHAAVKITKTGKIAYHGKGRQIQANRACKGSTQTAESMVPSLKKNIAHAEKMRAQDEQAVANGDRGLTWRVKSYTLVIAHLQAALDRLAPAPVEEAAREVSPMEFFIANNC